MGNITSTLTLKLNDDISGQLQKAAASLKGFNVSVQDLQKAAKIAAFRTLSRDVDQASLAFKLAQQNVRKLQADIAGTDSPTKRMQQALASAQRASDRARQSFVEQGQSLRTLRREMSSLGVPINQVASEEARLRTMVQGATAALEQQASRANSIGARMRRGLGHLGGNVAPFLGPGLLGGTKKAVEAGAHLESERMRLRAAGIPEAEIARADTLSAKLAAENPTVSRTEILERFKESRSVLLHPEEAMTMLPVVAKTNAALKALEAQGRVDAGSAKGLGFAMKGAEVLGVAQDPKRLEAYLDSFVKAKQVMGDLITTEQIYDFATNVKGSGASLSDRFLHTTAMSLTGELRGMRAGTGVDQFVKQITGGFQGSQHAAAKEFLALGLLGNDDFEKSKTGSIKGLKAGRHVAGSQLAMTDPDKWVQQILMPAMRAHHITDEKEQLELVKRLFTSSRAADIVTKLITQAPSYANHAQQMNAALGLASMPIFAKDPTVQFSALKTAAETFAATFTSPLMQSAAHAMNFMARTVANWATVLDGFNKSHPEIAKQAAGAAVGAGLIGGGALTYQLFQGLKSGFGLKGSATALDGSAVALTRAAVALGGSSVVGGAARGAGAVEGAAVGAAAKGGKGLARALGSGLLRGTLIGGAILDGDQLLWDSLPEAEKKKITTKIEKINALKPMAKQTKAETLRRAFNKERRDLGLPSLGGDDFTFGGSPTSGFRMGAQTPAGFTGSAGSANSHNTTGLSGGGMIGAWVDQTEDARKAGETVGRAYYDGLMPEMRNTLTQLQALRDQMVAILSFTAAPNVTPGTPGGGAGVPTGSRGESLRGVFGDYGVHAGP